MAKFSAKDFYGEGAVPAGASSPSTSGNLNSRDFYTGGNRQGMWNGWDTPFMRGFIGNYQAAMDQGTQATYFEQKKDGIALWNDQRTDVPEEERYKLGDVFKDGKKIGNLNDTYDAETVDNILRPLILSPTEQQGGVRVQDKVAEIDTQTRHAYTRKAYESEVKQLKDDWDDNTTAGAAIAAGAAGGALIGSAVGPIGTLAGAVIGGGAAFLNRDELEDLAARGEVQARAAEAFNPGAGATSRLQSWGGIAQKAFSPLSNLTHGVYDATVGGGAGDQRAGWYENEDGTANERNPFLTGLDVGATLADAAGLMATPAGMLAFQGQMGATIAGKGGTAILTGGQTFDERRGEFDSFLTNDKGEFDPLSTAGGLVDIGIDVAQLGFGRGLAKASGALGKQGAETPIGQLAGAAGRKNVEEVNGLKFVIDPATGKATSHSLSSTLWVPSELTTYAGARLSTLMARQRTGKTGPLTSDELFQGFKRFSTGPSSTTYKFALVNGFAEGTEEAVQSVAEALSHNAHPQLDDIMNGYLYGGAMGAGMTVGSRLRTRKPQEQMRLTYNMLNPGEPKTPEEWAGMSEAQKDIGIRGNPFANEALKEQANQAASAMKATVTASTPEIERWNDAVRNEETIARNGLNRPLDGSYITSQADFGVADHQAQASIRTVLDIHNRHAQGLATQATTEDDPQLRQVLTNAAAAALEVTKLTSLTNQAFQSLRKDDPQTLQSLLRFHDATIGVLYEKQSPATNDSLPTLRRALSEIDGSQAPEVLKVKEQADKMMQEAFGSEEALEAFARATTVTFGRNPMDNDGSMPVFQMLSSFGNSMRNADTFVQLAPGVRQTMGLDHDGDMANTMVMATLNAGAFLRARTGNFLLGLNRTPNIEHTSFEKEMIGLLASGVKGKTNVQKSNAKAALRALKARVKRALPKDTHEVVDRYVRDIRRGDPDARNTLLEALRNDFPVQMQEHGEATFKNLWWAINTAQRDMLTAYQVQEAQANRRTAGRPQAPSRNARPHRAEKSVRQRLATRAATYSQKIYATLPGVDMFRKWQKLHYSARNSIALDAGQQRFETLRELTDLYEAANSAKTDSALDALDAKDEIAAATLKQLYRLMDEHQLPHSELAIFAMTWVPDIQIEHPNTREPKFGKRNDVTLLQWLYRENANRYAFKHRLNVADPTSTEAMNVNRARRITAGEAVVDVLGGQTFQQLLGLDGDVLGASTTVAEWVLLYVNQPRRDRQADSQALKAHATYRKADKNTNETLPILPERMFDAATAPTPYTALVDALLEYGNNQVSWSAQGKNADGTTGLVTGRMGETSAKTSANFRKGVQTLHTAAARDTAGIPKDAKGWRARLQRDPRMMGHVLGLVTDRQVLATWRLSNGQVILPDWIYGALAMKPAEAEMEFLRQGLLAEFRATQQMYRLKPDTATPRINDRLVLLMHQLAEESQSVQTATGLDRFLTELFGAKNVNDFIRFVNNEIAPNEAPFTAHARDIVELDPFYNNGGWSQSAEGAVTRERIRTFAEEAGRYSQARATTDAAFQADQATLLLLEQALKRGKKDSNYGLVLNLQRLIKHAETYWSSLAPNARRRLLTLNLLMHSDATDKAKASPGFDAYGEYQALRKSVRYATPEDELMGAETAFSTSEMVNDLPRLLLREHRLIDSDGTPIERFKLTPKSIVENWRDPNKRALLQALLVPQTWEHTVDGKLSRRALIDTSLSSLASGRGMYETLFKGDAVSRAYMLSAVDSMTQDQDLSRYLLNLTTAYSTTRPGLITNQDQAQKEALQAEQKVAQLLPMLAGFVGQTKQDIDPKTGKPVTDETTGEKVMVPALTAIRNQLKHELRMLWGSERGMGQQAFQLREAAFKALKLNILESVDKSDPDKVEEALRQVKVLEAAQERPEVTHVAMAFAANQMKDFDTRFNAYEYIYEHPSITTRTSPKYLPTLQKLLKQVSRAAEYGDLPELRDKEWVEIGEALVEYQMQVSMELHTAGPGFPVVPGKRSERDMRFYSPTWDWVLDDLVSEDSPMLKGYTALIKDFEFHTPVALESELRTVLKQGLLRYTPEGKGGLGKVTAPVIAQLIQDQDKMNSAGAAKGVGHGGLSPQFLDIAGMALRRKTDDPTDALLSTLRLSYQDARELLEARTNAVPVTDPDGKQRLIPASLLDGRFAASIRLVDRSGNEVVDIDKQGRALLPFQDPDVPQQYGAVTRYRMRLAMDRAIAKAKPRPKDLDDLTFELRFFNPSQKPAEMGLNLFFDGTILESGDGYPGLESGHHMVLGGKDSGASQQAMSAGKTGGIALGEAEWSSPSDQTETDQWQTSLSHAIELKVDRYLRMPLAPGETPNPLERAAFRNSVRSSMLIRTVVRWVNDPDADVPEVTVLSAQEAINLQLTDPNAIPKHAEIQFLSDPLLRAILGDTGPQAALRAAGEVQVDRTQTPLWTGRMADYIDQVPGLFSAVKRKGKWVPATRTIFDTNDLRPAPLQRASKLAALSEADQIRYNLLEVQELQEAQEIGRLRISETENAAALKLASTNAWEHVRDTARDDGAITRGERALGLPETFQGSEQAKVAGEAFATSMMEKLERHSTSVARVFYAVPPLDQKINPVSHLVGRASLTNSGTKSALWIAPKDTIVVALDSFAELEDGALKELKAVLHQLTAMGTHIALTGTRALGDLRTEADLYLAERGYQALAGQSTLYSRVEDIAAPITERQRQDQLVEVRAIETSLLTATIMTDQMGLEEEAAWALTDGYGKAYAKEHDWVPTKGWGGFHAPTTEADDQRIDEILRDRDTLYAMSVAAMGKDPETDELPKNLKKALDRDIDQFISGRNEAGFMSVGAQHGPGSFTVRVGPYGRVLILRHAHKNAPTPEALEALFKQSGDARVAISDPSAPKDKTWHRGRVLAWEHDSRVGHRVVVASPMSEIGAKEVEEVSALKTTIALAPSWLKLAPIAPSRTWARLQGKPSIKKEVTHGAVLDFRSAFTYLGVDFTDDVARTILGVAETDAITDAQRSETVRLLTAFRKQFGKYSLTEVEQLMNQQRFASEVLSELKNFEGVGDGLIQVLQTGGTDQMRITKAIFTYLLWKGARVDDVLSAGGALGSESLETGRFTREMPALFTNAFDLLPLDDPLRVTLMGRLNNQLGKGVELAPNFEVVVNTVQVDKAHPSVQLRGILKFSVFSKDRSNPVLNQMALDKRGSNPASLQQLSVAANALGVRTATSKTPDDLNARIRGDELPEIDDGAALVRMFRSAQVEPQMALRRSYSRAELDRINEYRDLNNSYRHVLDTSEWEQADKDRFLVLKHQLMDRLGMAREEHKRVDFWARQLAGARRDIEYKGDNPPDRLHYNEAEQLVQHMLTNVAEGRLPVIAGSLGSAVWLHTKDDLAMMFSAANNGNKWWLNGNTDGSTKAATWDEWVLVNLAPSTDAGTKMHPMFMKDINAVRWTMHDAGTRFAAMPLTETPEANEQLMTDNRFSLAFDNATNVKLAEQTVDPSQTTFEEREIAYRNGSSWREFTPITSFFGKQDRKRRRWAEKNNSPKPVKTNARDLIAEGNQWVTDGTVQNGLMRTILALRAGLALANPMLYIGAPIEAYIKETQARMADIVTGEGRGLAARFMPEEIRELGAKHQRTVKALGSDATFKKMVGDSIKLDIDTTNMHVVERWATKFAKLGGRWQDPYWGMRQDHTANRYLTAAIGFMRSDPNAGTFDESSVLDRVANNHEWLQQTNPAAHRVGLQAVMDVKNVRPTTISKTINGVVNPLLHSNKLIPQITGMTIKLPYMFAGYTANRLVQVLGLQPYDQLLAMLVHGKKNKIFGRLQAAIEGREYDDTQTIDMSDVIETLDLTNAFVKSGISHSALFAFGLMAGGLGLSGEDEEDRRRRRAAQAHGGAYLYDPRALENDFRNADAIYLDWLPVLSNFFRVTNENDPSDVRSMANMNWIVKSILNPVIGMERFFNTGNSMELVWAFQDAFYSMPLVNTMLFDDAMNVYSELAASAYEQEELANPQSMPEAFGFMVKSVMSLERMLLESSFINQIYQAMDKYDRDSWVLPDRREDAGIGYNNMGVPQKTGMLKEFTRPDGTVGMAYQGRDWWDATMHGYTENRFTAAILGNLFTFGQGGFLRQEQAVKVRKIDNEPLSMDESMAVIRGLWKGTVRIDSRNMQGIYVPYEHRQAMQAAFMKEIIEDGINQGLNEYKAKQRFYQLWNGSPSNPNVKGLRHIVWDKKLPVEQSTKYYQLNTTYIMGPDGKPWATGIHRHVLANLAGNAPLLRYHTGDTGLQDVDGRLNSVDAGRGINTGQRALEKIPEGVEQPDIAAQIKEALQSSYAQNPNSGSGWQNWGRRGSGWRRFGRGGGGFRRRGGGGGGGSFTRMQAPPRSDTPYVNTTDRIDASNPLVRRANIRRERIDSQKGRLNQWQ